MAMQPDPQQPQINAVVRQLAAAKAAHDAQIQSLADQLKELRTGTRSPQEEIDSIPGRRLSFTGVQTQIFTATQAKTRAGGMNFIISQDGPFILTHYPMVSFKSTGPSTATNFGNWGIVDQGPLPTQQISNMDQIWLSWELLDAGSGRQLQDSAASAALLSYPGQVEPLPVPTLFAPGTTITFTPTYENINFASSATPTTTGTLVVMLPGFKIVNGA